MTAGALTDALRDLWGPGLVFIALCVWLVRRAVRAARNESILEEQRVRDAINPPPPAPALAPSPAPVHVPARLFRADVRGVSQEHLDLLANLLASREGAGKQTEVLWVRSNATHVAWGENRTGDREVICVAQVDGTAVVARWQFG